MTPYGKPERAVVTGGCGFLGQALVRTLLEKEISVTVIDLPEKEAYLPKRKGLDFQPNVWQGDTERKYDVFYHLAWAGSAGEGRKDGFLQAENIRQTLEALALAKKLGCHTFIFAGSIMEAEVEAAKKAGLSPKGDVYKRQGQWNRGLPAAPVPPHFLLTIPALVGRSLHSCIVPLADGRK